ncbi:MAG: YbaB/EbfC family nucleoid-associated protein [Candidatus Xenobiia bacterium LiM19]
MRFNPFSLMKAISETMKNSKELESHYREMTKEPLCGYNGDRNIRAFLDPNSGRFTKIQIKPSAEEGKEIVDILEEVTAAVNDALGKADELWEKLTPDSVKKVDFS